MLCNGFWCYIGSPVPASTNDIGLLNTEWPNIKRIMDPKERDLMIADRIFIDFEKKIPILCGWRREGGHLDDWALEENIEMSDQRGFLERRLGNVKVVFDLLKQKYRGKSRGELRDLVKLAFVLDNIKNYPSIIQQKILKLKKSDWEQFFEQRRHWLSPYGYVPLFEIVIKNFLILYF